MLKAGIIGVGSIGTTSHEAAINNTEYVKLTAVADVRKDAAEEVAARNGAKAFTDYRDLLASDVDIVFVCTPPDLHVQMGIDVVNAGKHLFMEKPVALTMESALELKAAVDEAGVRCQAGYVVGFLPGADTLRREFKAGRVGKLVSVMDIRIGSSELPRQDVGTYRDWVVQKRRSGGVLIECFTHEIAWIVAAGGEIDSVYANIQRTETDPRIDIDDNHWAILNYKDGGCAALGSSWANPASAYDKVIMGQSGALALKGEKLLLIDRYTREEQELAVRADADTLNKPEHFARCIMDGTPNLNTLDEAIYNLRVLLAMHKSMEENQVVKVQDI